MQPFFIKAVETYQLHSSFNWVPSVGKKTLGFFKNSDLIGSVHILTLWNTGGNTAKSLTEQPTSLF